MESSEESPQDGEDKPATNGTAEAEFDKEPDDTAGGEMKVTADAGELDVGPEENLTNTEEPDSGQDETAETFHEHDVGSEKNVRMSEEQDIKEAQDTGEAMDEESSRHSTMEQGVTRFHFADANVDVVVEDCSEVSSIPEIPEEANSPSDPVNPSRELPPAEPVRFDFGQPGPVSTQHKDRSSRPGSSGGKRHSRRHDTPQNARLSEVMYRASLPNPMSATDDNNRRSRRSSYYPTVVKAVIGGPDREIVTEERQYLMRRRAHPQHGQTGSTGAAPVRSHRRLRKKAADKGPCFLTDTWKDRQEKEIEKRDHDTAVELGYETLVGNIKYIPIPGAKDLNRSWMNFLSADPMEWGFPYVKGTTERPRPRQPEIYLVHQVKERLWKFPKTKIFQAQD